MFEFFSNPKESEMMKHSDLTKYVITTNIYKLLMTGRLCSKFDLQSFEAKNRVFQFDYQKINMFEYIRCPSVPSQNSGVCVRSSIDE